MKNKELLDFEARLCDIALPTISTPLHKARLRTALLAEMQKRTTSRHRHPLSLLWALFSTPRFRLLHAALPMALVLVAVLVWQGLLMPAPTLAYATLHANPAVQLTVDTRGRVTELALLSPQAAALLAPEDFRNQQAGEAVKQIVTRLQAGGFLRQEAELVLLMRSAPAMPAIRVEELADNLQAALESSLQTAGMSTRLRRHTVSEKVYAESRAAGLLPLDFVALLETALEEEELIALFHLKEAVVLDEQGFRARFAAMSRKVAREWRADMDKDAVRQLGRKFITEEDISGDDDKVKDDDKGKDVDEVNNNDKIKDNDRVKDNDRAKGNDDIKDDDKVKDSDETQEDADEKKDRPAQKTVQRPSDKDQDGPEDEPRAGDSDRDDDEDGGDE